MDAGKSISRFSVDRPRLVTGLMVALTLVLALWAALPSIWPHTFDFLSPVKVDTDPENMLRRDEPVRVFHNRMKHDLSLHDMVVVGVVNDDHPDGVFNPESLRSIHRLTEFAKTLRWPDPEHPGRTGGVVEVDVIAPSTVDNIEPGAGAVRFEWLMRTPPTTRDQALAVRDKALRIPFLNGTVVSEDGKALCLYLPLTAKDLSHRVYSALRDEIATYTGTERYHITGLPVAEDTFGVEMFIQMGISAPLAMVVVFVLMLVFFRKLVLIVSPMVVAMVSVICTMGLLVGTGNTIHIMSSMIPIFIMPIAVLDSIHILSEFFERYQQTRDRRATILGVMDTLFSPMLYTSLTSAAGFASLALTPIPPVQVFGLYIAMGVMLAWVLTVTFIPAFVMLIPQRRLENFGATHHGDEPKGAMARLLTRLGEMTYRFAKPILAAAVVVAIVTGYGISQIQINDNPIKWFTPSHPIREADRVLNQHFGGTYMGYLALLAKDDAYDPGRFAAEFAGAAKARGEQLSATLPGSAKVFTELADIAERESRSATSRPEFFARVNAAVEAIRHGSTPGPAPVKPRAGDGPGEPAMPAGLSADGEPAAPAGLGTDDEPALPAGVGDMPLAVAASRPAARLARDVRRAWDEAALFVSEQRQAGEVFKDPAVLAYQEQLQQVLEKTAVVGKSNSLADIIKTVHREFVSGKAQDFRIPATRQGVGQMLIQYESSHRKDDLWHFVTPDFRKASIWVQLTSGDNKDMAKVVAAVDRFVHDNPPPDGLEHRWFGLTYINVIWQDKMVSGMLQAFLGSFLVVFLMMTVLYRSALWGLLSMIPLTVTIGLIYGAIGLVGKDYDMPVAVLSSLTLGLAVDFAIHFLARARVMYGEHLSWQKTVGPVFGEPALAIARNVIVIAVGFLPLLAAPLMPYKTVGVFLATILAVSGVSTLLILPALGRLLEPFLFPESRVCCVMCNCTTCIVSGVAAVVLVAVSVQQFLSVGWTTLTWFSLGAVPVLALGCTLASRREKCRAEVRLVQQEEKNGEDDDPNP